MIRRYFRVFATALLLAGNFGSAIAADSEDLQGELTDEQLQVMQEAYLQQLTALDESLTRRTGDITLGDGLATLAVPNEFYFLDAEDSATVLVDIWGNPPGREMLGMLFPSQYSPIDGDSWGVTIEYVEDGYVSDEDATDIDYDDLLSDMIENTRDESEARDDAGFGTVELLGWAEPPHYDSIDRKLYWALELQFGGAEESTLNYDIRALGRHGMLSMTFIANTSQLAEVNASRDAVLAMANFNEGFRYQDFDSNIDKVAAYGIGALVAGKIAAKTGLIAAGLLFFKKFAVFLFLGLAAFGKRLIGLFKTDKLGPE